MFPPYRKLWSLNTMMMAVFRPEAELMLFLRICTKEIAKSLGKSMPIEELLPYYRNCGCWSEWQGQIFDRKLLNAVKMFLNVV